MFISDKVKHKLRKDLYHATSIFESCFIEIESKNSKNTVEELCTGLIQLLMIL